MADNASYKGKGGLTQKMRKRLTCAARCAMKMRSQEPDTTKAVKLLVQDLVNGPLHCFGFHTKCSTDFCKVALERELAGNSQNYIQCSCESSDEDDRSTNIPSTSSVTDGADGLTCDLDSKCLHAKQNRL